MDGKKWCHWCKSYNYLYSKNRMYTECVFDRLGNQIAISEPTLLVPRKSIRLYCRNCGRYITTLEQLRSEE